jgi:hypothetical protein
MADKNFQDIVEDVRRHPAPLAIGGAALAGAAIGSIIPGIGTAIGAGVGGIIGGIGVIVHEVSEQDRESGE